MVALAACDEALEVAQRLPERQRRHRNWGLVGAAAAAVIGFAIGRSWWSDPNAQLLEDLPVLKNYDLYYQVDNIEFLKLLDRSGEFEEKDSDNAN